MYQGDGSYRNKSYNIEVSLLDLLTKEQEIVHKLNDSYRALEVAKKTSIRIGEYEAAISNCKLKLEKARSDIKEYCCNNLGIETDLAEKLYAELLRERRFNQGHV